ncbi:MAG: histidinol-phosphate transaminase [Actinomycetota bacterium]|nr:histidinol-phosphate transaminase [Actinomycetota bacterium]
MALPAARPDLGLQEGYHSPQVDVEVRLNTNESPYPPPHAWVEALHDELDEIQFNRYPDRSATQLRGALAELHGVRPDQVFAANGSNEVLQSLCLAYGGPGRTVAVFEPTYALHSHIAHLTGTAVVGAGRRPDFSVDVDVVADVVAGSRPAITFLCSPNNPTGMADDAMTVRQVLGEVAESGGLMVVDEAYGQFADWSAVTMVDDDVPLVVTRTFSKTWSLAGMRLGYLVGPAGVVANLERVALPYHLDAVTQAAGRLALRHVGEMEARVGAIVAERRRLLGCLQGLSMVTWPSQANFILFRPPGGRGHDVWQALVDRSVLVRDTSSWPGLDGCLRVTVGRPEENDRFLVALNEVMA